MGIFSLDANHLGKYNVHGPRCFLQELAGHVHFRTGGYGEDSSRLCNFEGFKLVTNLQETKEAKRKRQLPSQPVQCDLKQTTGLT